MVAVKRMDLLYPATANPLSGVLVFGHLSRLQFGAAVRMISGLQIGKLKID